MECEECSTQKEVVHRVQLDVTQSCDDEYEEEEKEQGHRREEADLTGQRPGLELLRHRHRDRVARQEVRVTPVQAPAVRGFALCGWGESVVGKIDVFEIRRHSQMKIPHRIYVL